MLTAHLRQATTLLKRADDYERLWDRLYDIIGEEAMHERTLTALTDAAMGFRVTNAIYRAHEEISSDTAARDLKEMVDRGLLEARGERRGRHYVGSDQLRQVWHSIRSQRRVDDEVDPFAA
jgi:predicted HTH transcriptional regulator